MFKLSFHCVAAITAFALAGGAGAKDYEVIQKDKKFSRAKLAIKVGDIVNFRNEDGFSHNIYSLSDIKTFDLGSYPKGKSRGVTFDQPGTVEVECAIHPDMMLVLEVRK